MFCQNVLPLFQSMTAITDKMGIMVAKNTHSTAFEKYLPMQVFN